MTFKDRYTQSKTWHERVLVMEIYHLAQVTRHKGDWTISNTATHFGVSVGLVSENLKLAHHITKLQNCPSRQEALRKIR